MKKLVPYFEVLSNVVLRFSLLLFGVAAVWLLLQIFCIASFHIPSDSMEPNLVAGDVILVNKWSYGARLFNVMNAVEGKQVVINRLPGVDSIRLNDVIVFNNPCPNCWKKMEFDVMKYYVKRCVGLPGDTFRIVDGRYQVDGYAEDLGNVTAQEQFKERIHKYGLSENEIGVRAYPSDSLIGWTVIDFGPFYIPRKGDVLSMDQHTVKLYKNVIDWEQGKNIECKEDNVYIGDSLVSEYRFLKNYYFVTGDNALNSRDSRYWGLLPEEYIVGKAWRIWKSVDKCNEKIRWERIWKKIE